MTITVGAVDDPPVAVNDVATMNEDAPATTIAVLANDTDLDGGAKTITAVQNPSANGGTVLITNGGADLTYQPAADYCNAPPATTPDTFTYTLSPGGSIAVVSVTVNCVNDAPLIANLAGDTLGYTQGDPPTPIDQGGDAAATDVDSPDFDTGTLTVSLPAGLVAAEDEIGIRNQGTGVNQIGVTGTDVTFNPGSGAVIIGSFSGGGAGGGNLVVTFNASAGAAAVSTLLRNITYLNSNTTAPTPANRTVRFVLSDGDGGTSLDSDATIAIALNTPPVLTANDTNLESATVRITAGFQTAQDVLSFVDAPPITGSFDPLTGILSLTGSATLADYQTALQSVTYQNTSQNPNTAARSVAFVANDGSANSNTITKAVTVQSVNDAPSFAASNPPTILEDAGAQTVVSWATFNPGPPDESGQAVFGYTVSNISNGALFSVGAGPVVAANGTLTYTPAANANGVSTFDVVVQDDGGTASGGVDTSALQTFTITVTGVNDAPSFLAGGPVTVLEDAGPQTVSPWATAISPGPNESSQTLSFNITNNTNPSLFSAGPAVSAAGALTFTPAPNAFGSANIMLVLQDNGGGDDTSGPQGFTITVTAVNDAPVATAKSHQTHSGIRVTIGAGDTGKLKDGATDVDDPFGDLAVSASFTSVTPAGATIVLSEATTGTFTYNPPAGFSGPASFQYQVCDDGAPTPPVTCSTPTTVSFNVTGPDLWFVDATAAAGGSGRRTDPFDALSDLPAGRGTGDRIFVFTGTYLTGHTLFTNEHLIGQGSSDTFDSVLGVQAPGNGTLDSRPTLGGTRPQLNGTVAVAGSSVVRGLNIVTNGATGLTGGAVTGVTVNEASVSATNATAVNLGAGGAFTLTRVDSSNAANGIILNNNPAGSFTVTGTGAAGTGGTIQNTTGDGVSLNSASSVSLNFMNVVNNQGNGIRGNNVTGFTLASSTVDNNADDAATDEAGLHFTNLLGTASITNTTVSNHLEDNARILNSSGTLSQLTITNSTFRDTDTVSPGNNGLLIQGDGNANMTVDITNSSFLRNRANGLQVINNGSGTVDVEIGTAAANSGGTFQNNNVGVNIAHNGSGTLPFDVLNAAFSAPTLAWISTEGN